ncbi:MAG: nucleoside deaminase [Spirochaetia bacterium]|nr:nucleoside deaminase [Spirochaetia bacterium]
MEKLDIMKQAAEQANKTMRENIGGPFGAAIVKDGVVLAVTSNSVLKDNDPTAHAEINAIRKAGELLGTHDLTGCELYATGYPCPMCLSAIIWANIKTVYYGCQAWEAEVVGFRDDMIYTYLEKNRSDEKVLHLEQVGHSECKALYDNYAKEAKEVY